MLFIWHTKNCDNKDSARLTCHAAQQAECRCSGSWSGFATPQRRLWRQRNGDGNRLMKLTMSWLNGDDRAHWYSTAKQLLHKLFTHWLSLTPFTNNKIIHISEPTKQHGIYYNHFTALFPGRPGWDGGRRELLDFMVQGKINRGRHIDHPAGCHSIRTNQCPSPPSLHFFTGRMPFLPPNQQCQSSEACHLHDNNNNNNDDDDKNNVNVNCAVIMNIAIERSLGSFDKNAHSAPGGRRP